VFYLDVAEIYLDVVYTCILQTYVSSVFRCFIRMFASALSEFCICLHGFQMFLGVFTSVPDACFNCFICLFLYVATVVSKCFKSRSGVAHGMRVGSG
jgi:hypothetical protein